MSNLINSFSATGIYPFNKNAVLDEAFFLSSLTERLENDVLFEDLDDIEPHDPEGVIVAPKVIIAPMASGRLALPVNPNANVTNWRGKSAVLIDSSVTKFKC